MNKFPIEEERIQLILALSEEPRIELEWAGVLDCGALGPSRAEPVLFHQNLARSHDEDRSDAHA